MNWRLAALLIGVICATGVAAVVGFVAYLTHWASQPLPLSAATEIVIEPGESFAAVADDLERLGVVGSTLFSWRARVRGLQARVQSGQYALLPGETADSLLDRLSRGDVMTHRFRIEEGETVERLLERLAATTHLRFDLSGSDPENLLENLGLTAGHAEGRFFPDTYQFVLGYQASALLHRAYSKMDAELATAWPARSTRVDYAQPYEALILASIVEKETAIAEDRPRVAGVFVRRLAKGMRLQSDPTVIYGLGDEFDGDLKRHHLRTDGRYNTYRRHGLPPTPIAFPSLASIRAALQPDSSDALYFVSRGDGSSQFSTTLADHNAAVRQFQLR